MPITLEAIKAEHTKLAEMIAAFEAQSVVATSTHLIISVQDIELRPGEHYAGILLDDDGTPSHHVILLPGDVEDINWVAAGEWAASIDGDLPTRREQSLLFANLMNQFGAGWYWSNEQHASDSDCAWSQYFDGGTQYCGHEGYGGRARAVRRLPIE